MATKRIGTMTEKRNVKIMHYFRSSPDHALFFQLFVQTNCLISRKLHRCNVINHKTSARFNRFVLRHYLSKHFQTLNTIIITCTLSSQFSECSMDNEPEPVNDAGSFCIVTLTIIIIRYLYLPSDAMLQITPTGVDAPD